MRLWHLIAAVAVASVLLTFARDATARTFLIVLLTVAGEFAFATAALLALFRTVAAIGEAKGHLAHAEAVAATSVVLAVATAVMSAWLFAGAWVLSVTT
jgi:hypothetical protein